MQINDIRKEFKFLLYTRLEVIRQATIVYSDHPNAKWYDLGPYPKNSQKCNCNDQKRQPGLKATSQIDR